MKYLLSAALLFLIFSACSKDKYQTKPSLKLLEVSRTEVDPGQTFKVTMEYTDKEGDLAGAPITIEKIAANCPLSNFVDSLKYSISGQLPSSSNQLGEIDVVFTYFDINPRCAFPDTAVFKFFITDRGGNKSDTVTTGPIIIRL